MSGSNLIALQTPKSQIAEAYRILKTNIQFSSLDKEMKIILITSTRQGEGKSTTAANLAVVMAQGAKQTLLIDCDQRKPTLHRKFNVSNEKGLSNILIGQCTLEEVIQTSEQDDLYILTSGEKPPNPSELLASEKMKNFIFSIKEGFDYIILDTPPVGVVADTQILSSYADGCVLVVEAGGTDRKEILRTRDLLLKRNSKILGVVLNKLEISKKGHNGGYYEYCSENEERGKKKRRKKK